MLINLWERNLYEFIACFPIHLYYDCLGINYVIILNKILFKLILIKGKIFMCTKC